jgi:hypothetical protein
VQQGLNPPFLFDSVLKTDESAAILQFELPHSGANLVLLLSKRVLVGTLIPPMMEEMNYGRFAALQV